MSDVFALDQTGQNDVLATASANLTDGSGPPGFWKGVPKAVGMAVPRGLAEIPRAIELAGALPVGLAEPFLGYKQGELTDKYFSAVDPTIKNAVDYWTPRPEEVGTAGRILGGAVEGLTQLAAGGFNPAVLVGTTTLTGAMDAADQGASPDVAAASGALQGVATAAGFKLPFLGKTLLTRVASGAAGNLALGRLSTLAQQQLLARTGNPEAAANYNPADLTGGATDLLMGVAYGVLAHATSPAERAAALTTLDGQHFQEGTAPGTPVDTASSVAHQQAIELAIKQILNGEPVTPPAPIMGAGFVPRSPAERLPPLRSTATDQADREAMDHIVSVLSGAKSRGVPLGEDLANLDAERALTVAHEAGPPVDPNYDAPNFGLGTLPETIPEGHALLVSHAADNSPERLALREALVEERFQGKTPVPDGEQPVAVFMGGGGASGKGTVKQLMINKGLLDPKAVSLDPDEFKTGSKKDNLSGIPEYHQIVEAGDWRAAKVTHEESSVLYKAALARAVKGRYPLVLDRTLGSPEKAIAEIRSLIEAGYKVRLIGVSVDAAEAIKRSVARSKGKERRFVPLDQLILAHKGFSQGHGHYANLVHDMYLFDNNVPKGGEPQLIASKGETGLTVHHQEAYNSFVEKGNLNEQATTYRELARPGEPSGTERAAGRLAGQPADHAPGMGGGEAAAGPGARGDGTQGADALPGPRIEPSAPAPAAPEAAPPGSTQDVLTTTGRRVAVAPRVVEASSLVTSDNPAFPQDLQPRDRQGRQSLSDQVTSIAQNLTPELLGPSATSDTGAPIVGPGGVVESGNGRVMALRDVYAGRHPNSPEKAAAYRAYLESLGHDTTGIQHPVLVRERVGTMTPEERQAFTTESNKSTAAEFSPVELAQADAKLLDSATMSLLRGEDLTTEKNGDFRRAFMKKLSAGERNALVDSSGNLSQEGERRLQAAILAKAYGGTPESNVTLGRLLESTSDEVRSALGALQDAAHAFAKLRQMIQDGALGPEYDIAPAVLQAVEDVARLRRTKTSLAEHLATSDMFSPTSLVIKAFYDPTGNRVASREKAAAALERYASQAMHERTNQAALFSDAPLSPTDILQSKPAPQTGDMFGLRTPQTGSAPDPVVQSAQQMAVENPKLRVATGEFDANGNAVTVPVGELLAQSQADIAAAQEKAKAYEAAVGCAMAKGN